MAMLKCKMCGGDLSVADDAKVVACDYCGTTQTVPDVRDEIVLTLFNRANALRLKCDFDKAEDIYRKIINEKPDEAEGYWGLVLCKFGIEYVEDPSTFRRVPTCHRTSFEAVTTDVDYLSAIEHADSVARTNYEESAKEIDKIQKEILAVVKNEKPFDVFICYKETDESGKRTQDSVIANDIYHQLTQEGFKVFFAAITLEDKLGEKYEPYIFAALNSAKVMLVLGTRPEYFTAVWVKNEWSRFLKLMKTDSKKLLIPCYRDMDAYELPEEFSLLQAQDMSKIGFINDVVRGIKKVITPENASAPASAPVYEVTSQPSSGNIDALSKRGFMALEDGEWIKADDFFEQVLNFNAELASAYVGKLMAQLKVKQESALADCNFSFENNNNYQKALRFGDDALKARLNGYIETITERNLDAAYQRAEDAMNNAKSEHAFKHASELFAEISTYRDSVELSKKCLEQAEEARLDALYNQAVFAMNNAKNEHAFKHASELFAEISTYRDSKELSKKCLKKAKEAQLDIFYNQAVSAMNNAKSEHAYKNVARLFDEISTHRNSAELSKFCLEKAEEILRAEAAAKEAAALNAKKIKKMCIVASIVLCVIIAVVILLTKVIIPSVKYNEAIKLYENGQYDESIALFTELDGFNNSKEYITKNTYAKAIQLYDCEQYDESLSLFNELDGYEDSENYISDFLAPYREKYKNRFAAGYYHTVGIRHEGSIVSAGSNNYKQRGCYNWRDIIAVTAGSFHTVGLHPDGTVVAVGSNGVGQCNVSGWTNTIAVAAGENHTVGLRSDGTVVATGDNESGQCDVFGWSDIVAVAAGKNHTVGLRSDGTVVATGDKKQGQCDVSDWSDIIAVATGYNHTVGLHSDGTVVAVGSNNFEQCNVSDFSDVASISAAVNVTAVLRKDGTVSVIGNSPSPKFYTRLEWRNIAAISIGGNHILGVQYDGTVVAVGDNDFEQCEVSSWNLATR